MQVDSKFVQLVITRSPPGDSSIGIVGRILFANWVEVDRVKSMLFGNVSLGKAITRLSFAVLVGSTALPSSTNAAELSDIRQRGYIIVGVKDNLRPLGFRDATGELQGLEIDLARQMAAALLGDADAVRLQPLLNQDRLPALLEDQVDILIARVGVTASRARLVDFSDPYYIDGTAFLTRDPTVQGLRDLMHQPIAVLNGSDTIATVRSLLPQVQLVGANSYEDAKTLLETNQAVAFAADASVLSGWTQEEPVYRLLPNLISAEVLAVAMPKGIRFNDLRQQVNQTILQLQSDGWIRERIQYWGLPAAGVPSPTSQLEREMESALDSE